MTKVDSETRKIFPKNLAAYMEISGMQGTDLADRVGASRQIVSDWLNGKKYPRIDMMQEIADVFHVTLSELMFGEDLKGLAEDASEDMKTLFRLAKHAKPEAVRAAVAVLKSMEETNHDF